MNSPSNPYCIASIPRAAGFWVSTVVRGYRVVGCLRTRANSPKRDFVHQTKLGAEERCVDGPKGSESRKNDKV